MQRALGDNEKRRCIIDWEYWILCGAAGIHQMGFSNAGHHQEEHLDSVIKGSVKIEIMALDMFATQTRANNFMLRKK
jgi:hypothetical protein